ncbi:hypothetical protein [Pseudaestuariivita sp.]|uniref:hypothetical protein n=1 Tax=Pseudaestuariivita sp. TaxID=2211669 RepID=UPI00405A2D78
MTTATLPSGTAATGTAMTKKPITRAVLSQKALFESYRGDESLRPQPAPELTQTAQFVRWMARIVGVALMVAALGLWAFPGVDWTAELAVIKLGLTCFFTIAGALSLTVRKS